MPPETVSLRDVVVKEKGRRDEERQDLGGSGTAAVWHRGKVSEEAGRGSP